MYMYVGRGVNYQCLVLYEIEFQFLVNKEISPKVVSFSGDIEEDAKKSVCSLRNGRDFASLPLAVSPQNVFWRDHRTGLSLRAGGREFPPTNMQVASGYFHWKLEKK